MNKAQAILSAVINRQIANGGEVIIEQPAAHVYESISAAKRAITLSHKKWINKRQNDHQVYIQSIVRTD